MQKNSFHKGVFIVLQIVSVWDDIREVATGIFFCISVRLVILYLPSLDIARDFFVHFR